MFKASYGAQPSEIGWLRHWWGVELNYDAKLIAPQVTHLVRFQNGSPPRFHLQFILRRVFQAAAQLART